MGERAKDPERFEIVYQAIKAGCVTGQDVERVTGYPPRKVAGAMKKLSDTGRIVQTGWVADPNHKPHARIRTWRIAEECQQADTITRLLRSAW